MACLRRRDFSGALEVLWTAACDPENATQEAGILSDVGYIGCASIISRRVRAGVGIDPAPSRLRDYELVMLASERLLDGEWNQDGYWDQIVPGSFMLKAEMMAGDRSGLAKVLKRLRPVLHRKLEEGIPGDRAEVYLRDLFLARYATAAAICDERETARAAWSACSPRFNFDEVGLTSDIERFGQTWKEVKRMYGLDGTDPST